jgi:hypothetical protein
MTASGGPLALTAQFAGRPSADASGSKTIERIGGGESRDESFDHMLTRVAEHNEPRDASPTRDAAAPPTEPFDAGRQIIGGNAARTMDDVADLVLPPDKTESHRRKTEAEGAHELFGDGGSVAHPGPVDPLAAGSALLAGSLANPGALMVDRGARGSVKPGQGTSASAFLLPEQPIPNKLAGGGTLEKHKICDPPAGSPAGLWDGRSPIGPASAPIKAIILNVESHLPPVSFPPVAGQIVASIAAEAGTPTGSEGADSKLHQPPTALSILSGAAGGPREVTKILSLRLEPASLGTVTVRMRLSGPGLGLEVEAEHSETAQFLAENKETLAARLRSLGYLMENVVIKQAPPHSGHGMEGHGSLRQGAELTSRTGAEAAIGSLPFSGQEGGQAKNGQPQPRGDGNAPAEPHPDGESARAVRDPGARYI